MRAFTVLFGIALGAAVFTSVRLSVNASLDSFSRSMDLITGRADRVLIRPGGYVSETVISKLLNQPAIKAASPMLTAYVRPVQTDADPFLLIGFDPILDRPLRDWRVAGSARRESVPYPDLLKDPYTLIVAEPLAQKYHLKAGDYFSVEHARQKEDFRIVGILAPQGLALVDGGRVAFADIATFQEFIEVNGMLDRIDLLLQPAATPQDLEKIIDTLPEGVVLGKPSAARDSGEGMIRAYQLNLSVLSFASLFVGMFLVYSLVALNAASRRHELAVLRCTGASPSLLFIVFLAEGALLGIAGWVVAIPISGFLIRYLIAGISQTISTLFVRVQVDGLSLSLWELFLSFAITVIISTLAALQPAREAMAVPPKEALEIAQHGKRVGRSPRNLALGGLGCIVLVVPLSRLPGVLDLPIPGYFAILLLFVGFSLIAPWHLIQFGRLLSPAVRRLAGLPGYLAGRYVRDSGIRTAVSVGALITAVALFASLVIMIYSFRQTVELWTSQTISGDLFVTTKLNEINQFRHPISSEAASWFQSLGKEVEIVPNRRFFLRYGNHPYEFEALELKVFFKYADFFWMKKESDDVRTRLTRGEGVAISEVFSNRTGLKMGDMFRARIEGSRVELPVLGVVRDYRTQGGVVFYSIEHFRERYHDPRWSGLRLFVRDRGQDLDRTVDALRRKIVERWGDGIDIISGRNLRQSILKVFDETFAVTTVLLLIALIIAALGIATTLTVLVLERSRQLNTLFAIGASFGQIRSMIFWEAAFLVVTGEVVGTVCGFLLSYLLIFVINRQSFGWTFLYGVDGSALLMSVPLIVLTALGAALPAIRMVFREQPAALLKER
jgi:putative ABC transport system permease protein